MRGWWKKKRVERVGEEGEGGREKGGEIGERVYVGKRRGGGGTERLRQERSKKRKRGEGAGKEGERRRTCVDGVGG